ncbi:hypothetical protein M5K25_005602 [Dendrobium thyrsiflorum]|uniref:Uncharacterized protein n=1 Tax=Dendrobium thyrsiflorum TaxID=117978 RepID=A0ABD0VQ49_DENTH
MVPFWDLYAEFAPPPMDGPDMATGDSESDWLQSLMGIQFARAGIIKKPFEAIQRLLRVIGLSLVVGLLPVDGFSSDIYPTLNFLWSPDFCLSPDFYDAGLLPVTRLLPCRHTFARRWTFARRRTFVGYLPDAELPSVAKLLPVVGLSPDFCPSSDSRRTSATLDFRQSQDSCLVARLSPVVGILPVVGLSSDIYPMLNFLRSPDFCPSSDSRRTSACRRTSATLDFRQSQDSCLVARLSPVVGILPVVGLSSDIYPMLNFLRSPDFCPSSDSRRTSACRRTSATLDFRQSPDFCLVARLSPVSQDSCLVARLSPVVGLLPVVGLSSDVYPTLNFLRSPDFCPSPDFCDAGLSSVTRLLPRRQTFAGRWTLARRRTFVGHLPDAELPSVAKLLPVVGLSPDFCPSPDFCDAGLSPVTGLLPRRQTFAPHRTSDLLHSSTTVLPIYVTCPYDLLLRLRYSLVRPPRTAIFCCVGGPGAGQTGPGGPQPRGPAAAQAGRRAARAQPRRAAGAARARPRRAARARFGALRASTAPPALRRPATAGGGRQRPGRPGPLRGPISAPERSQSQSLKRSREISKTALAPLLLLDHRWSSAGPPPEGPTVRRTTT